MTEEQLHEEPDTGSLLDDSSDDDNAGIPIEDYKHLQSAFTKSSQEVGALKQQLADLMAERESSTNQQNADDGLAFLDSEEVRDAIDADPAEIVKYLKQAVSLSREQLEKEVVETMRERDAYYHQKFRSQDPTYQAVKGDLNKLRSEEPAFKDLSDDQLMAVLKRTDDGKKKFRGSAGGSRSPSGGGTSPKDVRDSDLYKKIYGGE